VAPQVPPVSRTEPARGHRGWLIGLLVTLAVALVLGIEQLMDPTGYVRDVTLLIAIPVGLAAAVTIFVARRSS